MTLLGLVRSFRLRLLVAVGLVVVAAVTVVGLVASRVTTVEFHKFREHTRGGDHEPSFPDGIERRLAEHFDRTGTWHGADRLLVSTAGDSARAGLLILLDSDDRFAAASSGRLTGASVVGMPDGTFLLTAGRASGGERRRLRLLFGPEGLPLVDLSGRSIGTLYSLPALPGDLFSPADRFLLTVRRGMVATVAGAGLLALLLTYLLARRIVAPVEELTAASRRMARGDLGQRVRIRGDDEIAQLSSAFNAMADGLQRTERLRRQMVTDVAHELRTPLTALRCQLESVQDGVVETSPALIASLHADILTLQRLVDDLQDLALVEAGQIRLQLTRIEPAAEIEKILRSLPHPSAPAGRLRGDGRLRVDLDGLPPLEVDRDRFDQILRNLLVNALTHTPPGGAVAVTGRALEDKVEINVSNEGPGIPPEHLPHIFERFYRADPSRQRGTGGAGLGLAIVKSLVEAHGGEIRVASEPGRGAVFSLSLPRSG